MNIKKSRKDNKRTEGFTLIELLVVVVIIGILAAVSTPIYLNQRKAAWKATAISDVSTGTLAVESARTQAPDGSLNGVEFGGGQDGQPMTITLNGDTTKSPVSPGNTETAWTGKTASGEECYAVMTTNKNIDNWAAVRTSVSGQLTTGTPPANGSADCPRPSLTSVEVELDLGVLTPGRDTGDILVDLAASGYSGSPAPVESRFLAGSNTTIVPGDLWYVNGTYGYSKDGDGSWTQPTIVSINGKSQSAFSKEAAAENAAWGGTLRIVLDSGDTITVDTSAADPSGWTGTLTPAA